MFRLPLRLIAWVHEPGLGLRLWRQLAARGDAGVELQLVRDADELRARAGRQEPHLVLLQASGRPDGPDGDRARLQAVLAGTRRALVVLLGGDAHARASGADGHPRVVPLEALEDEGLSVACEGSARLAGASVTPSIHTPADASWPNA